MSGLLLERLEVAREIAGIPFTIDSGFRCSKHNLDVGGESDSAHLYGLAADIHAENSRTRFIIHSALLKAGFIRLGIGKTFIHADWDTTKDPRVIWLY